MNRMSYRHYHSDHRFQRGNHVHGAGNPPFKPSGKALTRSGKPPLPPRVYTDADIHVDIVDLSFNDVRKVQTGVYPDGDPLVEYLTEKQANDRGFLAEWQAAQAIDEYRLND